MQPYDIIGDIHGHAAPLKALLEKLGYRVTDGRYAHPERKVIFLGDFIDRGPAIREVLQIVRGMTDSGAALAVQGNHEFNALAYATPNGNGGHLRIHGSKNKKQHQATLDQIAKPHPEEWRGWLDWFRTLPLFLDLADMRAVHAAWNDPAVALASSLGPLSEDKLKLMADKKSAYGRMKEILLNGLEIALPKGHVFTNTNGHKWPHIRTRWWVDLRGKTYRESVFPDSDTVPPMPIPAESFPVDHAPYPEDAPPVFMGHYWLPPVDAPTLQASNIAVLDYSVAKQGNLAAYRWDGEQQLDPEKFVVVRNRTETT